MDATLELKLCDLESGLYEMMELLDYNTQTLHIKGNHVHKINETLESVIQLIWITKANQVDIEKSIDLLSIDGIGSKEKVKAILSECSKRIQIGASK